MWALIGINQKKTVKKASKKGANKCIIPAKWWFLDFWSSKWKKSWNIANFLLVLQQNSIWQKSIISDFRVFAIRRAKRGQKQTQNYRNRVSWSGLLGFLAQKSPTFYEIPSQNRKKAKIVILVDFRWFWVSILYLHL